MPDRPVTPHPLASPHVRLDVDGSLFVFFASGMLLSPSVHVDDFDYDFQNHGFGVKCPSHPPHPNVCAFGPKALIIRFHFPCSCTLQASPTLGIFVLVRRD